MATGWETTPAGYRPYSQAQNAYVLVTGETSGTTVIDIDDPTLPHCIKLMDLMNATCGCIQATAHGFHYVWKYDARIKETTSTKLKIDTRNRGLLLVAPSYVASPQGEPVAYYRWDRADELVPISQEILSALAALDERYVIKSEDPEELPTIKVIPTPKPEIADKVQQSEPLLTVVEALPIDYLDNFDSWVKIGLVFFNEGMTWKDWDKVSKRSKKYQKGVCSAKWVTFCGNPGKAQIRAATLWKWLKESNPSEFYRLMPTRRDIWTLINHGVIHNNTADYFYNMNPDSYIWGETLGWYSLTSNNTWKSYGKHQPPALKKHVADCMQTIIKDTRQGEVAKYQTDMKAAADDDESRKVIRAEHNARMTKLDIAFAKYGSSDFCRGVIDFLPQVYIVDELEKKMDMNRSLFAFEDGVFDLEANLFRAAKPSDYICQTTGYAFPKKPDPAVRSTISELITDMFDDTEVPIFLMSIFALCLYGGNKFEEFYVLTGKGGNGKGVLTDLLQASFGDYYFTIQNSLLTKENDKKDAPCPALVDARVKRIMMATEPEADDRLQCGLIKQMTGGDQICARTLFSKDIIKYVPQYKVFMQTNFVPKLNKIDGGIERRVVVIAFPHEYKRAEKMTGLPHQRLANADIKDKLCKSSAWRDEFMLMLLERWGKIKDCKSIPRPPSVEQVTKDYMSDNNPVGVWLNDTYEVTNDANDTVSGLLLEYNQMQQASGRPQMSNQGFKQALSHNGINQKKGKNCIIYTNLKKRSEEE